MIAEKIYDMLPPEWPLSIGDLPSTNDVAVAIMEYDGTTSAEYFGSRDSSNSSIFNPIVKIVVRHDSYATGQAWCETIKDTLHRYHDDYFMSILLVGVPMYLGRNEQKLHEFQVTFQTQVKE